MLSCVIDVKNFQSWCYRLVAASLARLWPLVALQGFQMLCLSSPTRKPSHAASSALFHFLIPLVFPPVLRTLFTFFRHPYTPYT